MSESDAPSGPDERYLAATPVPSVYVAFQGLQRVSPFSLIGECAALGAVRTLGEVQQALAESHSRLKELELFKNLRADVSVDPNGGLDVTFVAEEKRREFTVSGNVDKRGEVGGDIRLVQPALFGGPLSATGSMTTSATSAREFLLRLSTPRFLGRRCIGSLDLLRSKSDESEASGYEEQLTQAMLRLRGLSGRPDEEKIDMLDNLPHVAIEAAMRDLSLGATGRKSMADFFRGSSATRPRLPSVELQQSRLRTFKTALHCSTFAETEDGSGQLRAEAELAGPPGDTSFFRGEVQAQWSGPVPGLWPFQGLLGCTGGLLLPLDKRGSCIQDRFFLGGATGSGGAVLKGFGHRGAGPMGLCTPGVEPAALVPGLFGLKRPPGGRREVDSLGGEVLLASVAALSVPLPEEVAPLPGAKLVGFLNAGFLFPSSWQLLGRARRPNGDDLSSEGGPRLRLASALRLSAGGGLALPLDQLGSLEITFSYPLLAQRYDVWQRWQVGLRLDLSG